MRHVLPLLCAGGLLTGAVGCTSITPLAGLPDLVPGETLVEDQNPFYIPLGPTKEAVDKVFDSALQVVADYGFEILETNRIDGSIETVPRIAPGLGLFLKPGSPLMSERVL